MNMIQNFANSGVSNASMIQSLDSRQHSRLLLIIALGIFLLSAIGIFFKPKYDWDMMAYVGLVKEQSYSTPSDIQTATYETVREMVPDQTFEDLKYLNERRKVAFEDPVSFVETLSFYRVRVGYWGLGYLLAKTGINEVVAFRLIGVLFYFAICVVILSHLVRFVPNRFAVLVLSILVAFYPPLMNLGRVVVPEIVTILGLVLGFSLVLREKLIAGAIILLATVFARTDVGVLCVFLMVPVFLVGAGSVTKRISAVVILALAIPTALWLNATFDYPGWSKLFTTSWVETLFYPVSASEVSVSPGDYIRALLFGIATLFQRTSLWLAAVLGVVISHEIYKRGTYREPMLMWFGALIAFLPARVVLYPLVLERYVTFYPILLFLLLVCLYQAKPEEMRENSA